MEDRLKKFSRLIDCGSYTTAAMLMHTSQPALTTSIQKLERELGSQLLLKGSHSLKLTASGQLAYSQGSQLLLLEKNLSAQLEELKRQPQKLKLGCIDSVADSLVTSGGLDTLDNELELSLVIQSSSELVRQLKRGQIDLAITVRQKAAPSQTEAYPLGLEQFALVGSHEAIHQQKPDQGSNQLVNFLAYNPESTTYALIEAALLSNGLTIQPKFYSTNPSVLLQLAERGKGITALPRSMLATNKSNLQEVKLKKPLKRPITALWQRGRKLPLVVDDFLLKTQKYL